MIAGKGDESDSMRETEQGPCRPDPAPDVPQDIELAPADAVDPVIELYKKDVDRTLLRELRQGCLFRWTQRPSNGG